MVHRFVLSENADLRTEIARGQSRREFYETTLRIRDRYEAIHNGELTWKCVNSGKGKF